jgi:hypothetical protein
MKTKESLSRTIKSARGARRKSLIKLRDAIEAKEKWSPEKKELNSIQIKLNQAIKDENWSDILVLAYELKGLAFNTINKLKPY